MANVRFVRTTKEKWLKKESYDSLALYFCEDTKEIFKGSQVYTDGIRVIPTKADLPECPCAADGVVYYITETKSGYMLSPDRTEWLQTIYAPVTDVTSIPESEIYNTVTTVGAVRDIENALYSYIDQEIANIEISGGVGKDGLSAYEIWLNEGHAGSETDFLEWLKGKDGVDGKDGYTPIKGVDYFDGVNGKSAYEIWLNNGHTGAESDFLDWLKGKDGMNGKDGVSGKDGKSAYEIWLDAGHSGSEDDFLQWLKGDIEPFGDVVTSIGFDGIAAGTSLKGKTVKDVLIMLLGIKEAPDSTVDYITENQIPVYSGLENSESTEVVYKQLDTVTANYTDQGFYTTTNADGEITNAGYQLVMDGNTDSIAQTLAICAEAKIVTAYQYEPVLSQWIDMGFDGTYWIETGKTTKNIDGKEVVYTTYAYNVELMGDAITATEYWRFEVEV